MAIEAGMDVDVADLLKALEKVGGSPERVLVKATVAAGKVVRTEARRRAPGPHVEMETVEKRKGKVSVDVGPDKEHWYYRYAETGAQPHEIVPSVKRALLIGGEAIKARADHPGMAAVPFLRPAIDEGGDEAIVAAKKVILEALRRAGS